MTSSIEELVLPETPQADGNMGMNANKSIVLKAANKVVIIVGCVRLSVSSSGVNITGGSVTHNGRNIGSTHRHGDSTRGIDLTGTPQCTHRHGDSTCGIDLTGTPQCTGDSSCGIDRTGTPQ